MHGHHDERLDARVDVRVARRNYRLAEGYRGVSADGLTDAHMLALACFVRQPFTTVDDVAHALGVPVAVAALLVADLQAAGMIEPGSVK